MIPISTRNLTKITRCPKCERLQCICNKDTINESISFTDEHNNTIKITSYTTPSGELFAHMSIEGDYFLDLTTQNTFLNVIEDRVHPLTNITTFNTTKQRNHPTSPHILSLACSNALIKEREEE
jgi:hypothetical protein